MIGLWSLFSWLAVTDRQAALRDAQDHLSDISSAYGEHASTLMQMGMPIRIKDMPGGQSKPGNAAAGEKILAQFRGALDLRGISVWIHKDGAGPRAGQRDFESGVPDAPDFTIRDGQVSAVVKRPKAGIVVAATMPASQAFAAWRRTTLFESALVSLISLVCAIAGFILFRSLRRREIIERELIGAKLELGLALETAFAADKSKSAFLAAMSHELRTPLNAIVGFSQMMAEEVFGPLGNARYKTYSKDIRASGDHLLRLINDILDVSRLEANKTQLIEAAIDISALIRDARAMVENQARNAGVALTFEVGGNLPQLVADDRRVMQVLLNLLSNAIKFTPAGGRVSLSARLTDGVIEFVVADTGIGISKADLPKAFESFGQIDSRLSRRYEGSGLGLPLARHIAELHGGTLTIESEVDQGTVATVRFPASRNLYQSRELVA